MSTARKAHAQGIERECSCKLTDELELSGSVGVIDAKYDDYDYGAGDFEGKHIENAPSHMARIGLACRNL